jgi:hypothetical protein
MLPADWEEYLIAAEKELKRRPDHSPKSPRPIKRLVSARQQRAQAGKANTVKAIYDGVNQWNQAQTIDPDKTTFTTNLGGSCEPDAPHGKATGSRS